MAKNRYQIKFPKHEAHDSAQDEVEFLLVNGDQSRKLRFHDYDQIYLHPGLYEQLFYDRLKCTSPYKIDEILEETLSKRGQNISELRVLDLGAGNGFMGEILNRHGIARMVGTDIIPEAKEACYRDRPNCYDDYYVADFTKLDSEQIEEFSEWSFDCLTSVAALGFGDIPPKAFFQALQFIKVDGWVAFNIKETFLNETDFTGFSRFIRELIFSKYLDVFHIEKYQHRLSIEGVPLFYYAVVAQKTAEIPEDFLETKSIE